jgi:hypothetical protein
MLEVECSMTKSVRIAFAAGLLTILMAMGEPASALVPQANSSLQHQLRLQDELITEIRARPGGWVRPAHYHWRPSGAIGIVTAATAAAWAGSPPAPGYCWHYTDSSRTQGFWDLCP